MILGAGKLCQSGVVGHVQCRYFIAVAIKRGYVAGNGYVLRCELTDYLCLAPGRTGYIGHTAQRGRVTRIFHIEHYRLPDLLRGGEGNHVCRSAA